jgi:hypothetical protein
LPSGFPTKFLYAFLIPPMCATCSVHQIRLYLITLITSGEVYKLWSSSLCSLLQPPATSSLLGPNVLCALLSDTLHLCSTLSVRYEFLHPYKTTAEIIVLYILMFSFLWKGRKTKDSDMNNSKHSANLICSLISSWMQFWFVTVFLKYLNSATFSKYLLATSNFRGLLQYSTGRIQLFLKITTKSWVKINRRPAVTQNGHPEYKSHAYV